MHVFSWKGFHFSHCYQCFCWWHFRSTADFFFFLHRCFMLFYHLSPHYLSLVFWRDFFIVDLSSPWSSRLALSAEGTFSSTPSVWSFYSLWCLWFWDSLPSLKSWSRKSCLWHTFSLDLWNTPVVWVVVLSLFYSWAPQAQKGSIIKLDLGCEPTSGGLESLHWTTPVNRSVLLRKHLGPLIKSWVPHLRGILLSGNKAQEG